VSAQAGLGLMYETGRGVPLDYVEAYKWLSLAAAQGHRSASNARHSIASIMTKQQVERAEAEVSEWQHQHPPQSALTLVESIMQR